jgi:hypothetical protein
MYSLVHPKVKNLFIKKPKIKGVFQQSLKSAATKTEILTHPLYGEGEQKGER